MFYNRFLSFLFSCSLFLSFTTTNTHRFRLFFTYGLMKRFLVSTFNFLFVSVYNDFLFSNACFLCRSYSPFLFRIVFCG